MQDSNDVMLDIESLRRKLATFEQEQVSLTPIQGEERLTEILQPLFRQDGYTFRPTSHDEDCGYDYIAEKDGNATNERVRTIVEYKHFRAARALDPQTVLRLMEAATRSTCSRALLLANTTFTSAARRSIPRALPFEFQLMNLDSLKNWIQRIENSRREKDNDVATAVAMFSRSIARLVAEHPRHLDNIEWRDMERLMAYVCEGLGFKVQLTRPAKDGGKDLILQCEVSGQLRKYLVEVKHWCSRQRVGVSKIRNFIKVVASERADRGLLLATYGITKTGIEALTEFERKNISFGQEERVVALCRTFVRAESGLWSPPTTLPDQLFEDSPNC